MPATFNIEAKIVDTPDACLGNLESDGDTVCIRQCQKTVQVHFAIFQRIETAMYMLHDSLGANLYVAFHDI